MSVSVLSPSPPHLSCPLSDFSPAIILLVGTAIRPIIVFLGEPGNTDSEKRPVPMLSPSSEGAVASPGGGVRAGQEPAAGKLVGLEFLSDDGVQLRNCNLLFSPGTYPIQPLEDFSLLVHLDVKAAGYFVCLIPQSCSTLL